MNYSVFMDDDKDNGSTDDVIGSMIDVASSAFYDIRAKLLDLAFPSSGRGFVADVFLINGTIMKNVVVVGFVDIPFVPIVRRGDGTRVLIAQASILKIEIVDPTNDAITRAAVTTGEFA